jgi:hypothetical protein
MKQRIPFVGPSHESRSINADAQRSVNCFLELDNDSPRAPVALYGTPGMEFLGTVSSGPWRGVVKEGNTMFIITGSDVYRMALSGGVYGASYVGTIGTSAGPIGIASNGNQILIVDGTGGWILTISGFVFAPITDPNFPVGVKRATYQDGYFIVTGNNSQKFYINGSPNDGFVWHGLDFASAEGAPDNTIGCISDHREVWINTGNATFPFERSGNTFIEVGCAAADTIAKLDNTLFWLGKDDRGGAMVWKVQGYTPIRVSDHAIEKAMQNYSVISDARGWTYQQEGHSFYVLSFPTADKTWVYDISTGKWHERAWMDSFGYLHMWRASCHVFYGNDHIVGDYSSGNFYRLNLDYNLDGGSPILRLRVTQAMENLQDRLFYGSLQIDMETGTSAILSLRYSDDGGHTWSATKTASGGASASSRVIFRRLGSGRNRVWELSTQYNAKFAILGAIADVEQGTS